MARTTDTARASSAQQQTEPYDSFRRRIGELDDDLGLRLRNLSAAMSDYAYALGLAGPGDKRTCAIFFFADQVEAITGELTAWVDQCLERHAGAEAQP